MKNIHIILLTAIPVIIVCACLDVMIFNANSFGAYVWICAWEYGLFVTGLLVGHYWSV